MKASRPPQLKDTCFTATTVSHEDGPPQTYFIVRCSNSKCGFTWQKAGYRDTHPAMLRRWFMNDDWFIDKLCHQAFCPSCAERRRIGNREVRKRINKHKTVVVALRPQDQSELDKLYDEIDAARDMLDEIEKKVNEKIYELLAGRAEDG